MTCVEANPVNLTYCINFEIIVTTSFSSDFLPRRTFVGNFFRGSALKLFFVGARAGDRRQTTRPSQIIMNQQGVGLPATLLVVGIIASMSAILFRGVVDMQVQHKRTQARENFDRVLGDLQRQLQFDCTTSLSGSPVNDLTDVNIPNTGTPFVGPNVVQMGVQFNSVRLTTEDISGDVKKLRLTLQATEVDRLVSGYRPLDLNAEIVMITKINTTPNPDVIEHCSVPVSAEHKLATWKGSTFLASVPSNGRDFNLFAQLTAEDMCCAVSTSSKWGGQASCTAGCNSICTSCVQPTPTPSASPTPTPTPSTSPTPTPSTSPSPSPSPSASPSPSPSPSSTPSNESYETHDHIGIAFMQNVITSVQFDHLDRPMTSYEVYADPNGGNNYQRRVYLQRFKSDGQRDLTGFGVSDGDGYDGLSLHCNLLGEDCVNTFDHYNTKIAVQSNNKVVVTGMKLFDGSALYIARNNAWRINSDGSLDTTFATSGYWYNNIAFPAHSGSGQIIVDRADNIYLTGQDYRTHWSSGPFYARTTRLQPNGAIDTTWGGGDGHNDAAPGAYLAQQDLLLLPDGRTIAVGSYAFSAFQYDSFIQMRNPDHASLDTSFGSGEPTPGLIQNNYYNGSTDPYTADGYFRVIIQYVNGDPKLLLGGGGGLTQPFIARRNMDGTLDTSLGGSGHIYITLEAPFGVGKVVDLAIQSDGKLIAALKIADATTPNNQTNALVRLSSAGAIDTSFGTNGWYYADADGDPSTTAGPWTQSKLLLQNSGHIYLIGTEGKSGFSDTVFTWRIDEELPADQRRYPPRPTYQGMVSAGWESGCGIQNGKTQCWGSGWWGAVGENQYLSRGNPQVVLSGFEGGVTRVDSGRYHHCAIKDGAAYCWGDGANGKLGDGSGGQKLVPTLVSGLSSHVSDISAGERHTCAIVNGGAKCWGRNNVGQVGDGTLTSQYTSPVQVSGLPDYSGVEGISAGWGSHTCAVVKQGAMCWGEGSLGQLGDNNSTDSNIPVGVIGAPAGSGVIQVAAGAQHSCLITEKYGNVSCWGNNSMGQLGMGDTTNRPMPANIPGLSGVVSISAGKNHTCALLETGAMKCWGQGTYGKLGNGLLTNQTSPVDVAELGSGVDAISAGHDHTCARHNGQIKCWGNTGNGGTATLANPSYNSPIDSGISAQYMMTARNHTCASDGSLDCWGQNEWQQLGDGGNLDRTSSAQVSGFGSGVSIVSGDYSSTCAIQSGAAYCWGANWNYNLGTGDSTARSTPTQVVGLATGVTDIANSSSFACAVVSGKAVCWGYQGNGRLGNGVTTGSTGVIQDVIGLGTGVTAVAAGLAHACAIQSGAAYCWGQGSQGKLGNGGSTDQSTPVPVTGLGSGVTAITAGKRHTCAVHNNEIKCWGNSGYGQVGNGSTGDVLTPALVGGISNAVDVSAYMQHTCATTSSGQVYCWGNNRMGQVGVGTSNDQYTTAQLISGLTASNTIGALSEGIYHSTCVRTAGNQYCWGSNVWSNLRPNDFDETLFIPTIVNPFQ